MNGLLGRFLGGSGIVATSIKDPMAKFYGAITDKGFDPYESAIAKDGEPYVKVMERPLSLFGDSNNLHTLDKMIYSFAPVSSHHHFISPDGFNAGYTSETQMKPPKHGIVFDENEHPNMMKEYTVPSYFAGKKYKRSSIEEGIREREADIEAVKEIANDNPDYFEDIPVPDLEKYDLLRNNCHDFITDVLWRGSGHNGR